MRIAVTGAGGFLGRHVLHALQSMDVETIAVVRPGSSLQFRAPGIEVVPMDISAQAGGTGAFARLGRPASMIHLAWGGLPRYQSSHHLDVELPLQRGFLESCVRDGLNHLVLSGTCLEYGLQSGELHEQLPALPCTQYGKAKDVLRRRLEALRSQSSLRLTWFRLFYLYGPGQSSSSLYSQIRAALDRGDAHFAMSSGDQVRDFMPVEDAAYEIAKAALRRTDDGITNLCSGKPTRVVDLVKHWLQEWNESIELDLGVFPYPEYEPFTFWGSRRKLDALSGGATTGPLN